MWKDTLQLNTSEVAVMVDIMSARKRQNFDNAKYQALIDTFVVLC